MSQSKGGPPAWLSPAVKISFVAILLGVGFVAYRLLSLAKEDLGEVAEIRQQSAARAEAEREAGAAYMDNLTVALEAKRLATAQVPKATLNFTLTNSGDRVVLKAFADVTFPVEGSTQAATVEKILLFDDSELSVRDDSPLVPGSEMTYIVILDVVDSWLLDEAECSLRDVRVKVDET